MSPHPNAPPFTGEGEGDVPVEGCGFAARATAFFIDLIWIVVLSMLIGGAAGIVVGIAGVILNRPFRLVQSEAPLLYLVEGTAVFGLYFVLLEWLYGATPGKRQLKLCVVRVDGEPCGLGAALIRALLRIVDAQLFGLVAYWAMRPPLYQRVGDWAAHTVVVRVQSPLVRRPRSTGWYFAGLGLFLLTSVCATTLLFSLALR